MVAIVIEDFGGRMPRRAPRLLPGNYSQVAENVTLIYGDLRGFQNFKLVHEFPAGVLPKRVWHVRNTAQTEDAWFGSTDPNASLIKSPIINDAYDRYYLFEKDQPPKVYTFNTLGDAASIPHELAFDQPIDAPVCTPTGGVSSNLVTRVYAYSYVTTWGEEGILSPVTSVNVKEDVTSVTVTIPARTPPPDIDVRAYQYIRIYRTVTGTLGGQFYYVADTPMAIDGSGSYVDTMADVYVAYGSALTSSQNDPVPDGIWGARVMGNGGIVAFKGRDLYFSVPYLPHAWPDDWRLTVSDIIVGVEVMGQNIMVMTQGFPVLLYGAYPDALGMMRFDFAEPCISYGSIVASPEGVYYGSWNGLCLFTPVGVTNLTREMIARNDWRRDYLDLDTRSERLGTRYIASLTGTNGYVIDGLEARVALTDIVGWLTIGDISCDNFTSDVIAISFNAVYVWDDPDELEVDYRWRSKQYVLKKPASLGAMMIHLEPRDEEWMTTPILNPGYLFPPGMDKKTQVVVKVWADGRLIFDRPVSNEEQCRLPSDDVASVWEVEIMGQCRVQRIALAETGKELSNV